LEKASEIYAYIGSEAATKSLQAKVFVHKNNIANFFSGGKLISNTYATHGNILMSRRAVKSWNRVEKALIPWVITRILFTGSGDIVSGDKANMKTPKFVISPRAMFTYCESSLDTTSKRGILNTRDQPHANVQKYWRFHDIHYEGLRNEYAIFMRDVTQSFVMYAFEEGLLDDAPAISDPVNAFKELSSDTQECKWKIELKNGNKTDAPDILNYYLDRIEVCVENTDKEIGEWDKIGLDLFKKLLVKLENRCIEYYVDGIDWVTKLALLVNYEPKTAKEGISICNQYALLDQSVWYYARDTEYTQIKESLFNPRESLSFVAKEISKVDWSNLKERVRYCIKNAPETTRDYFRSIILKKYPEYITALSWSKIDLKQETILLDEPFMLNKKEFDFDKDNIESIERVLKIVKDIYPDKVIIKKKTR
ncbi:MAG: proteasome accessory factor PafA2 family protein, partial [Methanosarcinales archaeon]